MTFYVQQNVIEANNFHKWSILLHRYDEASGKWVTYDTSRVAEDAKKVIYAAVVGEFSLFAISGDTVTTPVRFEETSLAVLPEETTEGKSVVIQVRIKNLTDVDRTLNANLWVNNVVDATEAVDVLGGKSQTVTFTTTAAVGIYETRVGRLVGSFSVVTEPTAPEVPVTPVTPPTATPAPVATATAAPPVVVPTPTVAAPVATPTTAPVVAATVTVEAVHSPIFSAEAEAKAARKGTPTPIVIPQPYDSSIEEEDVDTGVVIIIVVAVVAILVVTGGAVAYYRRKQST